MSNATDIFNSCLAAFPDLTNNLTSLIKCISDNNEQLSNKAAAAAAEAGAGSGQRAFLSNDIGSLYVILAGTLVFFMQTGFAMLCAGSIRAKNVRNVILWNLLDSCGGGIAFWAVGWGFLYGGDTFSAHKTFIGNTDFFVNSEQNVNFAMWFYQFCFACAPSSIVAGTIAERTRMKAYLFYSVFLVAFVYPVAGHAIWSMNGFCSVFNADPIFGSGAIDFAGSGVVHMVGGVAALVGGIILGPRRGRFYDEDGNPLDEPKEFPPHNVSLQFLGTFCLWFGWFGFNSGSAFGTPSDTPAFVAGLTVINTTLAACAAGVSAMFTSSFLDWRVTGIPTYDTTVTMNGLLTGLAAITAPCGTVEPWAAVVIGLISGWVYIAGSKLMIKLRIDDAVDAVPVHMFGGAWGLLACGLFSSPKLTEIAFKSTHAGWFYNGRDFSLCGSQLVAIAFIFGWVFVVMGAWFYFLNIMGWLRIDPLEEEVGMDQSRHKGAAYDIAEANKEIMEQFMTERQNSVHGKNKKQESSNCNMEENGVAEFESSDANKEEADAAVAVTVAGIESPDANKEETEAAEVESQ